MLMSNRGWRQNIELMPWMPPPVASTASVQTVVSGAFAGMATPAHYLSGQAASQAPYDNAPSHHVAVDT